MIGITLPIILTVIAIVTALAAYRGIRRGAARLYTLEREIMLRRASFTLVGSMLLFLVAVGLLIYSYQQMVIAETAPTEEPGAVIVTATTEPSLQTQPPTPTPTSTVDPNIPTPTATPVICRAIVDGTGGSGLTLRDAPSGAEITILPDGAILTLVDEEPVEANTFIWRKVRTVAREEGWVVESFLKIGDCR